MDERGIAARIHDLPPWQRRAVIALLLLGMVMLSWVGLNAVTPDIPIALWWPAAAFAVVAVVASRGRRLGVTILVAVIFTLLNDSVGRPLGLSTAYGVANAIEAAVVCWWLTRHRPFPRMVTLPEAAASSWRPVWELR